MPMFRFLPAELTEMEATALQVTGSIFPPSDVIDALAAKFNAAPDRAGKVPVHPRQVLTWFHNRRYAPRSKEIKARKKLLQRSSSPASNLQRTSSSSSVPRPVQPSAFSGSKRMDSGQFNGDIMVPQWTTHVQRHSVPFLPNECVDVHCRDLVLCYQESNEELPFNCDAQVLAAQRKAHDPSKCHCKFLVRYEHDQTEEIVPLERLRRRPPVTRYRLPNWYAANKLADSADRVQPTEAANVDLASNEISSRANTPEATMASGPGQEKLATSPETGNVSASGVATKGMEAAAAPVIIEIDDD